MDQRKFGRTLRFILLNIAVAAVLAFFLLHSVISVYRIEGDSMYPLLHPGERILITRLGMAKPQKRFALVVLHKPDEPDLSIIKRIVGLPGEIIEIRRGRVFIDNRPLPEPFARGDDPSDLPPQLIPRGCYFVIGDNRPYSRDSRTFGPVSARLVFGRALLRYWPFARFGSIE